MPGERARPVGRGSAGVGAAMLHARRLKNSILLIYKDGVLEMRQDGASSRSQLVWVTGNARGSCA